MQHFWTKQISASFSMISSYLCTIFGVTHCQLLRTLCHLHSLILTVSLCHQSQMLPSKPDENKLKIKNGTHRKTKELRSKARSINNCAMCFPKKTNLTPFLPTKRKKKKQYKKKKRFLLKEKWHLCHLVVFYRCSTCKTFTTLGFQRSKLGNCLQKFNKHSQYFKYVSYFLVTGLSF